LLVATFALIRGFHKHVSNKKSKLKPMFYKMKKYKKRGGSLECHVLELDGEF